MTAFDNQPTLLGHTLQLRPLSADDFEALYAAANAPETWAGHPATERHRREVFEPYFQFLVNAGGCLLILDRATGEAIGCSRYYPVPDQPDDIGIGFTFINHRYWGGATNRELKTLMLGHAFQCFERVWFHIAPSNIRSQKGTAKLGAELAYEADLDLSGTPARWLCYQLPHERWQNGA
ncbi:GNAT family N-acetyltransferase [Pseudomonas sp. PDNC002]|uniref:GNAT family N-acetyltransferase n=1 Tax=Pseudomonas sp. PDNC002 TaxID=2811422 RepID=UPI001963E223|nr:GNAT family N-acetyltransferase [Pseudomonas sp. PDNC002]QRY77967.1 GNAT family N-acetyltransferase [Pseudomonas sp. PDNC002]